MRPSMLFRTRTTRGLPATAVLVRVLAAAWEPFAGGGDGGDDGNECNNSGSTRCKCRRPRGVAGSADKCGIHWSIGIADMLRHVRQMHLTYVVAPHVCMQRRHNLLPRLEGGVALRGTNAEPLHWNHNPAVLPAKAGDAARNQQLWKLFARQCHAERCIAARKDGALKDAIGASQRHVDVAPGCANLHGRTRTLPIGTCQTAMQDACGAPPMR